MRVFNAREGLDRKADKLPKKFFRKLEGTGPTAGIALTHEEIETALDEYYRLAGLDKTGNSNPRIAFEAGHQLGSGVFALINSRGLWIEITVPSLKRI